MFDAIHVLDYGGEMYEDENAKGGWDAPEVANWSHIVHFDVQPGNCNSQSCLVTVTLFFTNPRYSVPRWTRPATHKHANLQGMSHVFEVTFRRIALLTAV